MGKASAGPEPRAGKKPRRWPFVVVGAGVALVVLLGAGLAFLPQIATAIARRAIVSSARAHGWAIRLDGLSVDPWGGSGAFSSLVASSSDVQVSMTGVAFTFDRGSALRGRDDALRSLSARSLVLGSGGTSRELDGLSITTGEGQTWARRLRSLRATVRDRGHAIPARGEPTGDGFAISIGPLEVASSQLRLIPGLGADAVIQGQVRIELRQELREEGSAMRVSASARATSAQVQPVLGTTGILPGVDAALGAALGQLGSFDVPLSGIGVDAERVVPDGSDPFALLGALAAELVAVARLSPAS